MDEESENYSEEAYDSAPRTDRVATEKDEEII